MYYLFSDNEVWHREITATSWRSAIKQAKDWFSIKGKIRCINHFGNVKQYLLIGTDYIFELREVNENN